MKLCRRHLRLFMSDASNWIISLLSIVVILSLYFLFIRDFTIQAIQDIGIFTTNIEQFVDLIMVSGLLVVISATTCLPISSIAVKDRERGIIHDFEVAPITRFGIHLSYIIAAMFISLILTILAFFIVLLYFHYLYAYQLSIYRIGQCIFLIAISSLLSSAILYISSLLFHSMTSFTSFGNLFGVLIGFLTGVYIPIGYYPQIIQNGLFIFPLSQTTSLLRNTMAEGSLQNMCVNAPPNSQEVIEKMFGLQVRVQQNTWNISHQYIFLCTTIVFLFFLLCFYITKHHQKS